jgi:1,4-alpha-glucan branching enzyme
MYMHSENYLLALSHDEVVHGKGSLVGKMAGDPWQQLANLRLLLAEQWTQPGKKLLFMGGEIAQRREWSEERQLDWGLLDEPAHAGIRRLVDRLNELYRTLPALHELDAAPEGFAWLEPDGGDEGVLAYLRLGRDERDVVLCAFNTTPVARYGAPLGAPRPGAWAELLNTDAAEYGGSGVGNLGRAVAEAGAPMHDQPHTLAVTLPPLGAVILAPQAV